MSLLVISHASCSDGFQAARIFLQKYPDCEIYFERYGRTPPDVKGRDVVIVDFSYKRAVMEQIIKDAKSVTVLDHHLSAQKDLEGLEGADITFDMNHSGAMLAHNYCFPDEEPNWITSYVEDRDIWAWKLPCSKELSAVLDSYPQTYEAWDKLAELDHECLIAEGMALLRKDQKTAELHVKQAKEVTVLGHKVLAVNATVLVSEIGHLLCKGRPFSVIWYDNKNERNFSFRSDKEEGGIDVSEIAKHFGGGGHFSASACRTDTNTWIWEN